MKNVITIFIVMFGCFTSINAAEFRDGVYIGIGITKQSGSIDRPNTHAEEEDPQEIKGTDLDNDVSPIIAIGYDKILNQFLVSIEIRGTIDGSRGSEINKWDRYYYGEQGEIYGHSFGSKRLITEIPLSGEIRLKLGVLPRENLAISLIGGGIVTAVTNNVYAEDSFTYHNRNDLSITDTESDTYTSTEQLFGSGYLIGGEVKWQASKHWAVTTEVVWKEIALWTSNDAGSNPTSRNEQTISGMSGGVMISFKF
ncbi:MAG TPA: hypothetical protein VJH89_01225 [Patescibacteria group bacterium]|nr:hypothetical protein [Patescibacteria group bacterium]